MSVTVTTAHRGSVPVCAEGHGGLCHRGDRQQIVTFDVVRSGFLHGKEPISTWWIAYIFDIKSLYLRYKEPISSMQKAYIDDAKSHSNASFEQQIQPRFFGHGHNCDHVTILFLQEAI